MSNASLSFTHIRVCPTNNTAPVIRTTNVFPRAAFGVSIPAAKKSTCERAPREKQQTRRAKALDDDSPLRLPLIIEETERWRARGRYISRIICKERVEKSRQKKQSARGWLSSRKYNNNRCTEKEKERERGSGKGRERERKRQHGEASFSRERGEARH